MLHADPVQVFGMRFLSDRVVGPSRQRRRAIERELAPNEHVLVMATSRGGLSGGGCLLAATAQSLLVASRSRCERLSYQALTSLTIDAQTGEFAFVADGHTRALKLTPPSSALQIGRLVAERIGDDRVHTPAGAAEYRRMREAFIGAIITICIFVGWQARHIDFTPDRPNGLPTPATHLSSGQCLDLFAVAVSCGSPQADVVVVRKKGARRCRAPSMRGDQLLVLLEPINREFALWCVVFAFESRDGRTWLE
jgi:hypothetical protein